MTVDHLQNQVVIGHTQNYSNHRFCVIGRYDSDRGRLIAVRASFEHDVDDRSARGYRSDLYAVDATVDQSVEISVALYQHNTMQDFSFDMQPRGERVIVRPRFTTPVEHDSSPHVRQQTASTSLPQQIDYVHIAQEVDAGAYVFKRNPLKIDQISGHAYYEEEGNPEESHR